MKFIVVSTTIALFGAMLLPNFGMAQEEADPAKAIVVSDNETTPHEIRDEVKRRRKRKRRKTHEGLQGTLWMQTSLEYAVAARQCYNSATAILPKLLADTTFTAAIEQGPGYKHLPPAIIMDVDETVLSNAAFQARMVQENASFNEGDWLEWVNEGKAGAIAGAAEFIHFARSHGVRVFFVTNRDADGKPATVKNLSTELSMNVDPENVLCKNEQADWGSDKTSRRERITGAFRIIMLFGDDFNDFAFLGKASPVLRAQRGMKFANRFGHCWFLLPNPLYGNWDKATWDYDYNTEDADMLKLKYDLLRTEE